MVVTNDGYSAVQLLRMSTKLPPLALHLHVPGSSMHWLCASRGFTSALQAMVPQGVRHQVARTVFTALWINDHS